VSYVNPAVDDLLDTARTNPTCDLDERRTAYHQAQATLQDDQPYIWLFAPTRIIVSRDDATLPMSELAQR
jgi:ABC-type transport system substrate-binding protein